ncbi:hypothetical protein [Streptomyces griseocarneus]|uniref:hypothetical protein n=1 Tax=Streptomyces griseocarneus TaxID=51201 RepID=UPI00167EA55D|nr:hypothetical protein [Streptomyces griseocarneus]MBZ6473928.1 hypothetical protein [Streptomyces griseocarneus]GHG65952.1 hypothetical protein GCM10018779_37020 [Streptomyces griseocarneus]
MSGYAQDFTWLWTSLGLGLLGVLGWVALLHHADRRQRAARGPGPAAGWGDYALARASREDPDRLAPTVAVALLHRGALVCRDGKLHAVPGVPEADHPLERAMLAAASPPADLPAVVRREPYASALVEYDRELTARGLLPLPVRAFPAWPFGLLTVPALIVLGVRLGLLTADGPPSGAEYIWDWGVFAGLLVLTVAGAAAVPRSRAARALRPYARLPEVAAEGARLRGELTRHERREHQRRFHQPRLGIDSPGLVRAMAALGPVALADREVARCLGCEWTPPHRVNQWVLVSIPRKKSGGTGRGSGSSSGGVGLGGACGGGSGCGGGCGGGGCGGGV